MNDLERERLIKFYTEVSCGEVCAKARRNAILRMAALIGMRPPGYLTQQKKREAK